MKVHIALSVLAAAVTFTSVATAQSTNALIAARKGAMNLQGKYAGPLIAMARGSAPYDARIVQRNAEYLGVLTQMPWDDFQPNSIGLPNTRAKDVIVKEPEKFKELSEELQANVQKLSAAAKGNDQTAVKAAAIAIGRTCNSCHERFSEFEFRFKFE
jgi:cytochrome c556